LPDDHDDNRELMQLLLSAAGYEVREARNGSEMPGNRSRTPARFDVMDLSMPGLDGWAVFRELKADQRTLKFPAWPSLHTPTWIRGAALKIGFKNAYVSKPFSSEVLLETVAGLISKPEAQ